MSINYFPTPYEDELLYSALARYHASSGNLSYTQTAEELFAVPHQKPSIKFITRLSDDVLNVLLKRYSMHELIMNHTLFPYYGRFLPMPKREKAYHSLCLMESNIHLLVDIPRNSPTTTFLRYCPICAVEDRERYGETYWHRIHQLPMITTCSKHCCYLHDSTIKMHGDVNVFATAETHSILTHIIPCCDFDKTLTEYMLSVFHAPVNMDNATSVDDFFLHKLTETSDWNKDSLAQSIKNLTANMNSFYKNSDLHKLTNPHHLSMLLNNKKYNHFYICELAFYLGISSAELTNLELQPSVKQIAETLM